MHLNMLGRGILNGMLKTTIYSRQHQHRLRVLVVSCCGVIVRPVACANKRSRNSKNAHVRLLRMHTNSATVCACIICIRKWQKGVRKYRQHPVFALLSVERVHIVD